MKVLSAAVLLLALFSGHAAAAGPLFLDKTYITKDTTWSGEVVLKGRNAVKRGVTLTILPGTVVKFAWTDEDGNDIGDGELTVEGRLVAKGSKDKMITFTSARPEPRKKDWTFIQINMSRDSVVEYCLFEYAFTGLQAHFSTATIRDNIFRNNFEGMRFSTADVLIEHNDFVNNSFGIRCESHGSRTTIRNNRLTDNDCAFFPVERTTDTVKIYHNNIGGSKEYSVKVGQNQKEDMDFTNNWWGTSDAAAIQAGIYDHTKDDSLGLVKYVPFLKEPVRDCGIM